MFTENRKISFCAPVLGLIPGTSSYFELFRFSQYLIVFTFLGGVAALLDNVKQFYVIKVTILRI